MGVEDVVDPVSLRACLKALSAEIHLETCSWIAFRAAARVLPTAINGFPEGRRNKDRTWSPLSVFGAVSITEISRLIPDFENLRLINRLVEVTTVESEYQSNSVANSIDAATQAAVTATAFRSNINTAYIYGSAVAAASHVEYAVAAAGIEIDVWQLVRNDLRDGYSPFWPDGIPPAITTVWDNAKAALKAQSVDWTFWIQWYDRVLEGRDTHAKAMATVFEKIGPDDWNKGPAHINPMFNKVLALYRAEDAAQAATGERTRATAHIRTIRAQVSTLQTFLETEFLSLSGHNARNSDEDDLLEILRDLKALVESMLERLDAETDSANALAIVRETLPAVIEKTGELAIVEPKPVVSETITIMAASIKTLVDSGADPKLATQIAMSEAAGNKLFPRLRRLFGMDKSGGTS